MMNVYMLMNIYIYIYVCYWIAGRVLLLRQQNQLHNCFKLRFLYFDVQHGLECSSGFGA